MAPSSTSNPATLLEFGVLSMKKEVQLRKLNFLHHIITRDEFDPVKRVHIMNKENTNVRKIVEMKYTRSEVTTEWRRQTKT